MAIPTKTFWLVTFLLQLHENVLFATHHVFVPFLNLLFLFGCFLTSKFLWLFYLVLLRREEMSLMSATLCSRPTSFLQNQHNIFRTNTAASCLQTSKLLASLKVLNTSNQKARFRGPYPFFQNCQNCYKCCAQLC